MTELLETAYFPPYMQLPADSHTINVRMMATTGHFGEVSSYSDDSKLPSGPKGPLCFMGEISNAQYAWSAERQHQIRALDRTSQTLVFVHFNFEPDDTQSAELIRSLTLGSTIFIRGAHQHWDLDGTRTIIVEYSGWVLVVPRGMKNLLEASKATAQPKHCNKCNKECARRCAKCKQAFYCSDTCQTGDWKKHKKHCPTLELIAPVLTKRFGCFR